MPADGSWGCEWPDCDKHAVTTLRTTLLGWMKTCRQHRNAWLTIPYAELRAVYRQRQPPHRARRITDRPARYTRRPATIRRPR